jgi:hypothetical protein
MGVQFVVVAESFRDRTFCYKLRSHQPRARVLRSKTNTDKFDQACSKLQRRKRMFVPTLGSLNYDKPFGDAGGYRWLVKEGRGVERGSKYTGPQSSPPVPRGRGAWRGRRLAIACRCRCRRRE